jgi:hypothetical protein
VTGESLGLLIEESRTNYRSYSSIPTVEYTSYINKVTIVDAQHLAPDGTASAISVANNTGVNDQYCWSYFTDYASIPTTGYICASIFVKMISGDEIEIKGEVGNQGWVGFAGARVNFSTPTPTVTLLGASGQNAIYGGVIPYPNNWWRVWFVVNTADGYNTGATRAPGVVPRIAGTSAYIWGAQIEAGTFPTSYIPTSGSQVTRSADVASMTGTNFSSWYNQSEGSFLAYAKSNFNQHINLTSRIIFDEPGTRLSATFYKSGTNLQYQFTGQIADVASFSRITKPGQDLIKLAGSYGSSQVTSLAVNGDSNSVATTTSTVYSVSTLLLGYRSPNAFYLNGHISRLTYYPTRLSDTQLQALTL